jgi:glutaredoxin 3
MTKVTMYVTPTCAYCSRAKRILQAKGVAWEEIDIAREPQRGQEMVQRSGGRTTVPQIFIGERHIGGYDDLAALEKKGELDPLLS